MRKLPLRHRKTTRSFGSNNNNNFAWHYLFFNLYKKTPPFLRTTTRPHDYRLVVSDPLSLSLSLGLSFLPPLLWYSILRLTGRWRNTEEWFYLFINEAVVRLCRGGLGLENKKNIQTWLLLLLLTLPFRWKMVVVAVLSSSIFLFRSNFSDRFRCENEGMKRFWKGNGELKGGVGERGGWVWKREKCDWFLYCKETFLNGKQAPFFSSLLPVPFPLASVWEDHCTPDDARLGPSVTFEWLRWLSRSLSAWCTTPPPPTLCAAFRISSFTPHGTARS